MHRMGVCTPSQPPTFKPADVQIVARAHPFCFTDHRTPVTGHARSTYNVPSTPGEHLMRYRKFGARSSVQPAMPHSRSNSLTFHPSDRICGSA